ncbi:MAG: hypothetical protein HUJ29_08185 [Gammaproteobacteria bacterium]|nr:hypothetical protein [Gammaproteobacteria bacterium]
MVQLLSTLTLLLLLPMLGLAATKEQALRDVYASIHQTNPKSQYPFHIISSEDGDLLSANIFMLLQVPYAEFRTQLQSPRNWCEFLILHLNIKSCVESERKADSYLTLYVGRKVYQPPEITYQLEYRFRLLENRDAFFESIMSAETGPMRTRDYRIRVQASPYEGKTLLRLGMQYRRSFFSKSATFTYLKTLGRNKIGFTITGEDEQGLPIYVDGVKAVIERNVMRYFLAVNVYLEQDANTDFQTRLNHWFDATQKYHEQLYEYDRETYIESKLKEYTNQQGLQREEDVKRMLRPQRSG